MFRTMLKSKIRGATVTDTNGVDVGSITVDEDLMQAADLLPGERIAIVDVATGARLEAYVVPGERGTGVLGVHDGTGYDAHAGDEVVMISYGMMDEIESIAYRPKIVSVDRGNRLLSLGDDAEPAAAESERAGGTALTAETSDAARLDALIQSEV